MLYFFLTKKMRNPDGDTQYAVSTVWPSTCENNVLRASNRASEAREEARLHPIKPRPPKQLNKPDKSQQQKHHFQA